MNNELQKRTISSAFIIPITFFFIIQGSVYFAIFLGIFFLIASYEWFEMNTKKSITFFGILYLSVAFYLAYGLRNNSGLEVFLFVIIICIFTDLGGYIFGKIFKGPRLTKISPNKTYSGIIGSFFLSLIAGLIYNQNFLNLINTDKDIISIYFFNNFVFYPNFKVIFLILLISAISQIGDLIMSYFKRLVSIKHTGKFLPGHGGLLDRIDGIIFAVPVFYLLINFFK